MDTRCQGLADTMARAVTVSMVDVPEAGRFAYTVVWHERAQDDPRRAWITERVARLFGTDEAVAG